MKQSVGLTSDLATGNYGGAAQRMADMDNYQRKNPGSVEGQELMQAWNKGDGIVGGLGAVGDEFSKDWNASDSAFGKMRSVGRNLSAMGAGVIEQTPNMLAPMAGMLAGGAAGSLASPVVGTAIGGWAGASLGNTAVEGGGMAQDALQKAGINPQDKAATRAYLEQNGDKILTEAGIKGSIIGAVDTATMGLGHALLSAPAKAAAGRAAAAGIDITDKVALKAAMQADPIYQAAGKGAGNLARNTGVAALEPIGEGVGEYVGQGVATGDWNEKNAFLEAASSIGQSGATFAGQKLYQGVKYPFANQQPPDTTIPGSPPAQQQGTQPAGGQPPLAGAPAGTTTSADGTTIDPSNQDAPITPPDATGTGAPAAPTGDALFADYDADGLSRIIEQHKDENPDLAQRAAAELDRRAAEDAAVGMVDLSNATDETLDSFLQPVTSPDGQVDPDAAQWANAAAQEKARRAALNPLSNVNDVDLLTKLAAEPTPDGANAAQRLDEIAANAKKDAEVAARHNLEAVVAADPVEVGTQAAISQLPNKENAGPITRAAIDGIASKVSNAAPGVAEQIDQAVQTQQAAQAALAAADAQKQAAPVAFAPPDPVPEPVAPVADPVQSAWDTMGAQQRAEIAAKQQGLGKKDGSLNFRGTNLVLKNWDELSPAQRDIVSNALLKQETPPAVGQTAGEPTNGQEQKAPETAEVLTPTGAIPSDAQPLAASATTVQAPDSVPAASINQQEANDGTQAEETFSQSQGRAQAEAAGAAVTPIAQGRPQPTQLGTQTTATAGPGFDAGNVGALLPASASATYNNALQAGRALNTLGLKDTHVAVKRDDGKFVLQAKATEATDGASKTSSLSREQFIALPDDVRQLSRSLADVDIKVKELADYTSRNPRSTEKQIQQISELTDYKNQLLSAGAIQSAADHINEFRNKAPTNSEASKPVSGAPVAPESAPPGVAKQPTQVAIAPKIIGERIDKTWTAFHPESGTLNVPRADMPQIKSEHRGAMINFLNARGIEGASEVVPAESLKPTQAEFAKSKVEQSIEFNGSDRPVLVSSDNHVLDGHHQWLGKLGKGEPVKITRLNAPITQLLKEMREFPSAGMTKDAGQLSTPVSFEASAPAGVAATPAPAASDTAPAPAAQSPLRVGRTPKDTEPVSVIGGVVHIGKYPAVSFEGEDVTVPEGASDAQIKQALIDAKALGSHSKIFGGSTTGIKPATAPQGNGDAVDAAVMQFQPDNAIIRGALNKPVKGIEGTTTPIKTFVYNAVQAGATVQTKAGQRVLEMKDGGEFTEAQLTKPGMDFAEYLVRQRATAIEPEPVAPAAASEASAKPSAAPSQPVSQEDKPIPAVTEDQARKQFEWRNMGQKNGTKTHFLFFFESQSDKGTGAAMRRGGVYLDNGASGWKVEDGDGTSYKSLADAKAAAIDAAIPVLQDQGYVLKTVQAQAAPSNASQWREFGDAVRFNLPPNINERYIKDADIKAAFRKMGGDWTVADGRRALNYVLGDIDVPAKDAPKFDKDRAYKQIAPASATDVQPEPQAPEGSAPTSEEQAPQAAPTSTTTAKKRQGFRAVRSAAYDKNPLMTFLARHGMYHVKDKPGSLKKEFSPDRPIMVGGYGPVFRRTGLLIDGLLPLAIQDGYLPAGSNESQMYDLIARAVSGEKISPVYADGVAEQLMQEQLDSMSSFEDFMDSDITPSDLGYFDEDFNVPGYAEASDAIKSEVNALLVQAEAIGIDTDSIKEDAARATESQPEQAYYEAARDALQAAIQSTVAASARPGSQNPGQAGDAASQAVAEPAAPVLSAPSQQDVLAQQQRANDAERLDEQQRIDRETRQQLLNQQAAPEQRRDNSGDMFGLEKAQAEIDARNNSGTDQAAQDAQSGQSGMFDEPVAPASAQPSVEELRAQADLMNALADLGDILSAPFRANLTQEQEQRLFPVLTRVMDAAIRLGYAKFKDAAKFALDKIRAVLGNEAADALTLDHFQGSYIATASGKPGTDTKRAVIDVADKAEIEAHTAQTDKQRQEANNVPSAAGNLERNSREPTPQSAVGNAVSADDAGVAGSDGQTGVPAAGSQGGGLDSGISLSTGSAVAPGEHGDQRVHRNDESTGPAGSAAGTQFGERGSDVGIIGVPPESIPASAVDAVAEKPTGKLKQVIENNRAEKTPQVSALLQSIRDTLPQLLPHQQEDVQKAETRFAVPDGYGMLFTNSTGTGKTFVALGVVKRNALQGKTNTLILVPDQKIMDDWVATGKRLNLDITPLKNTKDAGKGIVITTYANMGDNDAVAGREWELVVADEAHSLSQGKDGDATAALTNLRAVSHHPDGVYQLHQMRNRAEYERLAEIGKTLRGNASIMSNADTMDEMVASLRKENNRLYDEDSALRQKMDASLKALRADHDARQGPGRTRLLALSATPFAYEKSIDWANGYLFDYKTDYFGDETDLAYNQPNAKQKYFITRFGWSMRTNKLTAPEDKVDSGLLQRQWNTELKRAGSLSGRMLDVNFDYDRRFVSVQSEIGNRIDEALEWLSDKLADAPKGDYGFSSLYDHIKTQFDYQSKRYLLEAIKAKEAIPIIKQHLAMGRKVVVFHDFKKGGGFNPFNVSLPKLTDDSTPSIRQYHAAATEFLSEFSDLASSDMGRLLAPIELFRRELPKTLIVNGDEKPADNLRRFSLFQDDASGPQVMLVQSAKNKGWSGHDTTGKHQRVLINLGLPTAPTVAIQQEGRIYRQGQASNAIIRYFNTGTAWERWAFASTIAARADAAEGLGMGESARALRDAFIDAFNESDAHPPGHEGEGTGGKERDAAANAALTEYDRAKTMYWAQQKKNSRTKSQEGDDYYATPEPLGLKMVQWLDTRESESVLEPSAGHGAIARWLPSTASRTVIEPSLQLRSRLGLVMNPEDDRILSGRFEDLDVTNKFDGIVMNPPFGTGGKTAIEHLAKAATHLRHGGRIVALIPTGPAADAKFDKWFYETKEVKARSLATIIVNHRDAPLYAGDTVTYADFMGVKQTMVVASVSTAGPMQKFAYGTNGEKITTDFITNISPTGARTKTETALKDIHLVADIKLPGVTFERAGTAVNTRVVVLERANTPPQTIKRDLTQETDITGLFNALEDMRLPARTEPTAPVAEQKSKPKPEADKPVEAPKPKVGDTITIGGKDHEVQIYTTNSGKEMRGVWMDAEAEARKFSGKRSFTKYSGPLKGKWFVYESNFPKDAAIQDLPASSNTFSTRESAPTTPLTVQATQALVTQALSRTKGAVNVRVVASPDAIGVAAPAGTVASGMVDADGNITIFANGVGSAADVERVVFHELFHRGLQNTLAKSDYAATLLGMAKAEAIVQQAADAWKASKAGIAKLAALSKAGALTPEAQTAYDALAVEEGLAKIAESLKADRAAGTKSMRLRKIASWLARVADKFGLTKLADHIRAMTYSDAEKFVIDTLSKADAAAPQQGGKQLFSAKDAGNTQFFEDIPNENWLSAKRKYVMAEPRSRFGVPKMVSATGYFKGNILVPTRWLKDVKGERGEQSNMRQNDVDDIKKIIETTGKFPLTKDGYEYVPYVEIGYDGKPWLSEGNHRVQAAIAAGLEYVPIELKYFDGGQKYAGKWAPENILEITNSNSDAQARFATSNKPLFRAPEVRNAAGKLLAPNGEESKLTEGQWHQVRSPEFKVFFGDWENDAKNASKVIDPVTKEPMVVTHTTNTPWTVFDKSKASGSAVWGKGIYLATNSIWNRGKNTELIQLFLDSKNPLDITKPLSDSAISALSKYAGRNVDAAPLLTMERKSGSVADGAKAAGFDSIIHIGPGATGIHIVAFNPTQIKSATNNNGNFDPTNPDIRFRTADADQTTGFYSEKAEDGVPMFSRKQAIADAPPVDRSIIDALISSINGVRQAAGDARITVTATPSELPVKVLEQAKLQGVPENEIHGVLYKGRAYIVHSNLKSKADVEEVLLHEIFGHGGVNALLGDAKKTVLAEAFNRAGGVTGLRAAASRLGVLKELNLRIPDGKLTGKQKIAVVDEMLSLAQGKTSPLQQVALTWWNKVRNFVVGALNKLGFAETANRLDKFDASEAAVMLRQMRQAVIDGGDIGGHGVSFMTAWHGSPHKFDKFSTEHIGTGEGAQAYGWGIYFSSAKDVASWYKDNLTKYSVELDGIAINPLKSGRGALMEQFNWLSEDEASTLNSIVGSIYSDPQNRGVKGALDDAYGLRDFYSSNIDKVSPENITRAQSKIDDQLAKITLLEKLNTRLSDAKGNLYQVELAPKADDFLDWDKPLSEHSAHVRDAIQKIPYMQDRLKNDHVYVVRPYQGKFALQRDLGNGKFSAPARYDVFKTEQEANDALVQKRKDTSTWQINGETLYRGFAATIGGDKAASLYLKSIGVPGIRYLDGSSRSAGQGNYNYVIFDDADVSVTIRYSRQAPTKTAAENRRAFMQGSKIVNPDGTPKIMYHGTARDITKFAPKQADAIFLTDNPEFAAGFAGMSEWWMVEHAKEVLPADVIAKIEKQADAAKAAGKSYSRAYQEGVLDNLPTGQNIMPLIVNAQNPFDYENEAHLEVLRKAGVPRVADIAAGEWQAIESPEVQAAIKAADFDGFYVMENGVRNLAVYKSEQVKSATGNIGTYDRTNPDVRHSFAGQRDFTPTTVAALQQAIKDLTGAVLPNQLGRIVAATAADIKSTWEPLISGDVQESQSIYRAGITKVRGGWTKEKIIKELKTLPSKSGKLLQREIAKFDSAEQLGEHIFYHGTGGAVSKGLKPSITMSERQAAQNGGGGYGERYFAISVSKSKNIASNFTGQSRFGTVYPVILRKDANVISMPEISDASELEDHIVDLWNRGVDAVKLGDWNSKASEQELAILNPYAVFKYDVSESFPVLNKKRFEALTQSQVSEIYEKAVKEVPILDEIRTLGTKEERQAARDKLQPFKFSLNLESEGNAGKAQAFFDPATDTIFLIADNIQAGTEKAVLAHELMHKWGKVVLGESGWNKLHDVIETWGKAAAGTNERMVYDKAAARVNAVGFELSNEELFPYMVEEAILLGIKPNAMAAQGTVAKWLAQVKQALRDVWAKLTGKPELFNAQDMVDLAYAIAQRERHDVGTVGDAQNTGVLYTDENDNPIVYERDGFRISVNKPRNASYVVLWAKQEVKGRTYWRKAGVIDTNLKQKTINGVPGKYLGISYVDIEKAYRGQGLGVQMYRTLMYHAAPDISGIISYTPNRVNKLQVPKIYKKLGAITVDDNQIIPIRRTADDASIRYSRASSLLTGQDLPHAWQAPDATRLDDFIYSVQDKHIDTKRVLDAVEKIIGAIDDQQNPRLQEELFHGRAAKATKDFLEQKIRPLLRELRARGVKMEDLETYLHNRHAERRNIQIAKINKNMPDGGSGINTADARAYLAALTPEQNAAFKSLAAKVDAINKATRNMLVSSGLEKPETIAAWERAYGDEYVPLQREEMENGMGIGQGISVRGSASKRAMGSDKKVVDIFANIVMAHERAITRSEKKRVGEALYGLVLKAPNPDFWFAIDPALQQSPSKVMDTMMQLGNMGLDPADAESIAKEPTTRYISSVTGMVESRINPAMRNAENVLAVRINGEDKFVFFNKKDERAMRMVKALKNLDSDQLGEVMGAVSKATRYFSAINTQFNPIFGVVNIMRDFQTGMINLQSTALKGKQKAVARHVVPALLGIYSDLRNNRAGKAATSAYAQLFEEFQREGGATGFRDMYANAQERATSIQDEINDIAAGKAKQLAKGLFGWLSDYNEAMENAVRLSAYKVAKENGMSNQQAASLAKNLTVNFNRKGQVALQAGALYAFFNASVQGTARIAQTLTTDGKLSKVGKKIIAGGLLLGAMQALLLAAAGFEDDEPPDFVRERSLVIPSPFGDKKYLSIPMPLGFHVIPGLSRIFTEWALSGGENTPKRIAQIAGMFSSAMNPIGSAGMSMQTLAPTVLDPFAALTENKDWTGKPIAKLDFNSLRPTAGHTRAKDTASPWATFLSKAVNYATGGDEYKPGVASPTPDQIDYLLGQISGGVGREVSKISQVVSSAATGEELPMYKTPLFGRFVGTTEGNAAESSRFYENLKKIGVHKASIDGLRKDGRGSEISGYLQENHEARLLTAATHVQDRVSNLNKLKRTLIKRDAPPEKIKEINAQITGVMTRFNEMTKQRVHK